jgi:hypothetical protein
MCTKCATNERKGYNTKGDGDEDQVIEDKMCNEGYCNKMFDLKDNANLRRWYVHALRGQRD